MVSKIGGQRKERLGWVGLGSISPLQSETSALPLLEVCGGLLATPPPTPGSPFAGFASHLLRICFARICTCFLQFEVRVRGLQSAEPQALRTIVSYVTL